MDCSELGVGSAKSHEGRLSVLNLARRDIGIRRCRMRCSDCFPDQLSSLSGENGSIDSNQRSIGDAKNAVWVISGDWRHPAAFEIK
jgi:hypothetical protein